VLGAHACPRESLPFLTVNLSSLDLNLLVALDALLAERNVTRAARRIGRSQPATSHALARARRLFGDPLLVRVRDEMHPTERARALAPKLRDVLDRIASTLGDETPFEPREVPHVTLGVTDHVGFVLLPALVARLRAEAPRLVVRARALDGEGALVALAEGRVDVALGTFWQCPPSLRQTTLFYETFACALRGGHGALRNGRVSLRRYVALDHLLIASPGEGPGVVDHALEKLGLTRHVAAYVPHFLVAPGVVAHTDLVVTMAERVLTPLAPALGLAVTRCPVLLEPFAVRMLWHLRAEDDKAQRWLRAHVVAASEAFRRPAGRERTPG
jgi:DNA-binding transcriptional LysR family regulator